MDRLINALVTVALIEMMVAIGLGIKVADLLAVARNRSLVARAAAANYFFIPAVTIGLLFLFDADPLVAAGFLILAACPGAPYGPPFTGIAKGSVPIAVGLMVLLASSSAFLAPLLLRGLLPLVAGDQRLDVNASRIVATLLVTQLLPLCFGVAVRQLRPALAERLQNPAHLLSKILNVVAVGLILVVQFPLLAQIRPRGFMGMLVLLLASWATGWLLGGREVGIRKAMMFTTALRNITVGLVVATNSFADTPAVTAVAAYALVSLLGSLAFALFLGRIALQTSPVTGFD